MYKLGNADSRAKANRAAYKKTDKGKSKSRDYYQKNKERILARIQERRTENPEKFRNWTLMRKYGITVEEYDRIYELQGGRCAICGTHQSELKKSLAVDHNHNTGEVRGLLCDNCNKGIGCLQDSTEVLDSASAYLRRYK